MGGVGCAEVGGIDWNKLSRQEKVFAIDPKCKGKPLVSFKGLKVILFTL